MEDLVETARNSNYIIDVTIDGQDASEEERDSIFGGLTQINSKLFKVCVVALQWNLL